MYLRASISKHLATLSVPGRSAAVTGCITIALLLIGLLSPPTAWAANYTDEFTTGDYGSNDGTCYWSDDWQEGGNESDGAGSGRIQVLSSSRCASGNCLRIGGDEQSLDNRWASREADLSGATSATLTFNYRRYRSDESGGSVSVEVSGNGGLNWTTLATYNLNGSDGGQVGQSFDISPWIGTNTQVRFIGSGTAGEEGNYIYIDDVKIDYSPFTQCPGRHFAISHAGFGDTCQAANVTIASHADLSHATDTGYTDTITLSTSTGNGDWSLITGSGTLNNLGNGSATYTYAAGDNGQVILGLRNMVEEILNINVTDGTDSEDSSEDADLTFTNTITETFSDDFSSGSYSGGSGTWNNDWQEIGEFDGAGSGDIRVVSDLSDNRLRVRDNNNGGEGVWREVDLSGFSSATLRFDYRRSGLDNSNDYVTADIYDGATWTELVRFQGPTNDGAYQGWGPFDITPYLASNTRIRFLGSPNLGSNDRVYFDNVQIEATNTVICPGADHFAISHDGYGINCVAETITVTAKDSGGNTVTSYEEQITLDTQTTKGSWSSSPGNNGTFSDPAANDGLALYTFDAADNGVATFTLSYLEGTPVVDIDAFQTSVTAIRDDDTEGNISFLPNGFTVTPNPLGNPPGAILAVPTQTAGAAFALYITAYGQTPSDPSCGVIETYTGIKALKLWSTYNNPLTGSTAATIDGAAIATTEAGAIAQNVLFNLGQASVTAKYKDVGRIQIDLKDDSPSDPNLPNGIGGGSGLFVVKPAGFTLSNILLPSTAGDCAGGGALLNPIPANETGTPLIRAGEAFCVTVTARDAEGDVTFNYGQEGPPEGVTLTPALSIACTGCSNNPAIGFSTGFSFSNGVGVGSDFSWGEVGIMTLTPRVGDGDYLAVGDVIGTTSGNIGRFYPHDFNVTLDNSPSFSSVCGIFTYLEQQFDYDVAPSITITARNRSGSVTQNYDGVWWKLADFTETLSQDASIPLLAGVALDSGVAGHTPIDCSAGTCDGLFTSAFSGPLTYTKGTSASAPFNALIDISLSIVDADGAAYGTNPFIIDNIGFTAGNAEQRYGRLALINAHGSELLDLAVPLAVQYFADSSTGYITNTADNCTLGITLTLSDLDGGDGLELVLPNPETCVWDDTGTTGSFSCTPPGPIASQFVQPPLAGDFNLNLSAPGAGNTGVAGVTALAPAWLKFNWQGTGNQDPTSRATFGIYNTNTPIIFMRELR